RVRTDRRQRDDFRARMNQRSASGQGVRRRSGWRGKDQAVAGILRDKLVVRHDLEVHEARVLFVLDQDVIEREPLLAGSGPAFEKRAVGEAEVTLQQGRELLSGFLRRERREETETAAIHADQRVI